MPQRILVTYATWHESTAGVARKVADVLKQRGADVDVERAAEVTDVSAYDAVVVGSAIRMGSMHGAARAFLSRHTFALASKQAALFVVCLSAMKDDEKSRAETAELLKRATGVVSGVTFLETAAFAGGYDRSKAGLLVRFMFWAMRMGPGDFRDWDAIAAWAGTVADAFGVTA